MTKNNPRPICALEAFALATNIPRGTETWRVIERIYAIEEQKKKKGPSQ